MHIVSFDIPCPADYGGVIDVLGKIIALSEEGVKIALHCFEYGRKASTELENYCTEVHYYPRKSIFWSLFSPTPTIVSTRASKSLLKKLIQDNAPILFEGLHTCAYLASKELMSRKKLVRMHNIEHEYYQGLAKSSKLIWKKNYLKWEAYRLQNFESILTHADKIFPISNTDRDYLQRYGEVHYLPAFHMNNVNEEISYQSFALYHGNLQVEENEAAAKFLIELFKDLPYTLKIAGRNPCIELKKRVASFSNIELIHNPSDEQLKKLIFEARVNCLPTFQSTGIKLKLIQSLMEGNNVIVNQSMVNGTGLENYCSVVNTIEEWKQEVHRLFKEKPVNTLIIERRKAVSNLFDNKQSAKRLVEWFAEVQ